MMVAENTYKKPIGTNFNINTNQTNVNSGTGSETLGLFNSRRHVNNSNNIGGNINNKFKYVWILQIHFSVLFINVLYLSK